MELTCPQGDNRIKDSLERTEASEYSRQMTAEREEYIDQFTVPFDPRSELERFNAAWARFEAKYGRKK